MVNGRGTNGKPPQNNYSKLYKTESTDEVLMSPVLKGVEFPFAQEAKYLGVINTCRKLHKTLLQPLGVECSYGHYTYDIVRVSGVVAKDLAGWSRSESHIIHSRRDQIRDTQTA